MVKYGDWRVRIHRTSCTHYIQAHGKTDVVSPGMEILACKKCQPAAEDIDRLIGLLQMYRYAAGFGGGRAVIPLGLGA